MISSAQALSCGNAVKLTISVPPNVEYVRILRRTSDTFTGPGDTGAVLVIDECDDSFVIDSSGLSNGVQVFYRCYGWDGVEWVDDNTSFPATPATVYVPDTLDVQEFVRDRVQLGITAAIAAGRLTPPSGAVQVTTAPFSVAENTTFPTVSVHLESTNPEFRSIGDDMEDFLDPDGTWYTTEGWLARTALNIVGVSQNPDERIQLRKVIRQIIQSNLPVFAAASIVLSEFSQTDSEEFEAHNVPLYMTNGVFSCIAPAWIRDPEGHLSDVTLNPGVQVPPEMITVDFQGAQSI